LRREDRLSLRLSVVWRNCKTVFSDPGVAPPVGWRYRLNQVPLVGGYHNGKRNI